jgi:hypothetical protein
VPPVSRSLKIPAITPFKQFANNDVWLPGPLPSSQCSVRASDTLLAKTDGRPWVTRRHRSSRRCGPLGGGVGVGVENSSYSSKSSQRAQEQCGPCLFVAGLCVSSLDLRFAVHEEAPEPSGGEQQHCFLLWQISTSMYLSASLETVPVVVWAEGIFFGFFSRALLCYPVLGRFIAGSKR